MGGAKFLKDWGPVFLLFCLLVFDYRSLFGFSPISPLNQSTGGGADGQLFVPNQKSLGLIFGLAFYFLVTRLSKMRRYIEPSSISLPGVLFLCFGLATGIWSHYTGELALSIVSLSFVLMGIAGVLGGSEALRLMRLPALFLLLAVPVPGVLLNELVYSLQQLTAATTGMFLSLVGVEHVVSGDMIWTSSAAFHVIESCSGLRAIETLVMTAVVYQELVPHSRFYSWILVLISPMLGIFVNQLRVLSIVLNPFSDISDDHLAQGLVMIIFGTLLLAGFAALLAKCLPATKMVPGARGESEGSEFRWPLIKLGVVSLLLVVSIAVTQGDQWEVLRPEHVNPVRLPSRFGGWEAEAKRIDQEFFGSTRHTQAILRNYRRGEDEVSVFLAVDARKRPLLSGVSPKNASLGQGWKVVSQQSKRVGKLGEIQAVASVQRRLDRYAYVVSWEHGTERYAVEAFRNAVGMDRSPWQRPYDATFMRLSTLLPVDFHQGDKNHAYGRIEPLIDLVTSNFPRRDDESTD